MDCWVNQPLVFEDAAVMWWADFDSEDFSSVSLSPLEQILHYINTTVCASMMNNLAFRYCFNWED